MPNKISGKFTNVSSKSQIYIWQFILTVHFKSDWSIWISLYTFYHTSKFKYYWTGVEIGYNPRFETFRTLQLLFLTSPDYLFPITIFDSGLVQIYFFSCKFQNLDWSRNFFCKGGIKFWTSPHFYFIREKNKSGQVQKKFWTSPDDLPGLNILSSTNTQFLMTDIEVDIGVQK